MKRSGIPFVTALSLLTLLSGAFMPAASRTYAASSRYFPETGKTVNDPFLSYWTGHGGLAQQGFPITDAYNEKNDADGQSYITQYFERARFEYHPESSDPKFQVLLGLVGREVYGLKQASGSTGGTGGTGGTAVPPPPWAGVKIPTPLDTAFLPWTKDPSATRAYFVKDGGISIFDLKTNQLSTAPIPAQTVFPGLAFTTLTSAIAWPEGDPNFGTFLLFDGTIFSMFNMYTNQVIGAQPPGPLTGGQWIPGPTFPVTAYFPTMTTALVEHGFDAAAAWPPNSKYANTTLVCATSYCEFYDNKTREEVVPRTGGSIKTIWPGLPFDRDLDAVVPWPNGKVYFFKGDQYAVVDLATDKVDPGYPRPIN